MPSGFECVCANCLRWRSSNLTHGSMFHSNLTQESVDALARQNAPKGANAAKRENRPSGVNHRHNKRR